MLFTGIATPEQLKILATALEEYCRANDVRPGTPAYEQAACRIVAMVSGQPSKLLVAKVRAPG